MRRGIVDVNALDRLGVVCSIASNNILNPFTPFGDCSLLRMANLHANTLQLGSAADLSACFEMVSEKAARIMNCADYGLAPGKPADLVVIAAPDEAAAVAEVAAVLHVFKRGRPTVTRAPATLHQQA